MAEIIEFPKKKKDDFKFSIICCHLYCQKEATVRFSCIAENSNDEIFKHYCNYHAPLEYCGDNLA